jgi:hypothetical protein
MSFLSFFAALNLSRMPTPAAKAIQFKIDGQFREKNLLAKPESFVGASIIDQLERSGYTDSVYK